MTFKGLSKFRKNRLGLTPNPLKGAYFHVGQSPLQGVGGKTEPTEIYFFNNLQETVYLNSLFRKPGYGSVFVVFYIRYEHEIHCCGPPKRGHGHGPVADCARKNG
ncbi:hypothetical protein GCM10027190_41130 [Spirosoma areae]